MAKLMSADEAAEKARAKQAAKVAAIEAKRKARDAERDRKKEAARLFAAHCADAAKAFRKGDADGALLSISCAATMLDMRLIGRAGKVDRVDV